MKFPLRWSAFGRKTKAASIVLAAVALFALLFDWNWFRDPLEQYLSERSHRSVEIGDLHVTLGVEPTVRLRRVRIENAEWARKQPMADVGEVSFTFPLRSIWERPWIVSRLDLSDGEVNLERLADGHRNWRLRNPDDTGPAKAKILTMVAHRASVRFIEHRFDLDLLVAARSAEPGERGSSGQALTTRLDFSGTYRNTAFYGKALTGDLISFQQSREFFPARGFLEWGDTRVDADGIAADVIKQLTVDAKVAVAGSSLVNLHPFVPLPLPASRPYRITGQLKTGENTYALSQFRGKIGATDVAGDISYRREEPRSTFRADVHSDTLHLADLDPPIGGTKRAAALAKTSVPENRVAEARPANNPDPKPKQPDRVLPETRLEVARLKTTEAHIAYEAKKLKSPRFPALQSVRFKAELKDGVFDLTPFDIGVAGGHVTGVVALDAKEEPLSGRATLEFRGIRLEKLFPTERAGKKSAGAIGAQIKLAGRGDSVATLLGNSSGSAALAIEGGRISSLLDAETALNGGRILSSLLGGDKDIAIRCAALAVDFQNGIGQSRTLLFDTEQTRTEGSGTIDLRAEKFDFILRPAPKHPTILSLRAPVRVHGSFKHADVSVDKRVVLARAGAAIALAAINPLAAFLPLIETGNSTGGDCAAALRSLPAAQADAKAATPMGAPPRNGRLAR